MLSYCVICYNGLDIPDPAKQSERDILSKSREKCDMFFKLLERYLKPPGDNSFQPFPTWEKIFDVGIPISCGLCQGVMDSFCELFHQMKSIELLINWKLWTLKNVMHSAQRVPSRLNDFKEAIMQMKVDNGVGVEQLNLILNFKRNLIKNCRRKLLTTFPRLQLVKLQEKRDESVQLPAAVDDCINIPDIGITRDSSNITVPVQVTGNRDMSLTHSPMTLESDDLSIIDEDTEEQVVANAYIESLSFSSVPKELSKTSEGSSVQFSSRRKRRSKLSRLQRGAPLKKIRKRALAKYNASNLKKAKAITTQKDEPSTYSPNLGDQELNVNERLPGNPERCAVGEMEVDDESENSCTPPTKDLIPIKKLNYLDNTIPDVPVDVPQANETPLSISLPTQFPPAPSSRNSIDEEEEHQGIIVTSENAKTEANPNNSSHPEVVCFSNLTAATEFEEALSCSDLTPANTRDVTATAEPEMELEEPVPTVTEAEKTEESSRGRLRAVHRCVKCMKTFSVLERLLEHQRTHAKEKNSVEIENSESDSNCSADEDEEDGSDNKDDENWISTNRRPFSANPGDMLRNDSESDDSEPEYYNDNETSIVKEDLSEDEHGEDLERQPPPQFSSTFESTTVDITTETAYQAKADCGKNGSNNDTDKCNAIQFNTTEVHELQQEAESIKSLTPKGLTNKASDKSTSSTPDVKREATERINKTHGRTTRSSNRILVTKREKTSNTNLIALEAPIARRRGRRRQVFQCKIKNCEKKLVNKQDYENHQKLHGKFTCSFCDVTKDYAPELAAHEITEHPQIPENVQCSDEKGLKNGHVFFTCPRPNCSVRSSNEQECIDHVVLKHMELHQIAKKGQTCTICKLTICRAYPMKTHYNVNHNLKNLTGSTIKKCVQTGCAAYFLTSRQLGLHERNVHGIEKRYSCADCNLTFKTITGLVQHDRQKHKDELDYVCTFEDCYKRFKTNELLDSHFEVVHQRNSQLFQCKVTNCNEKLTNKEDYDKHQKLHGKFTCFFCDVTKDYAPELARHEIGEHSHVRGKVQRSDDKGLNKGSIVFSCPRPNCSVRNKDEQKYIDHFVLKHMGLHPIKKTGQACTICKLAYSRPRAQRLHYNTHHNLKNLTGSAIKKCVQTGCAAYFLTLVQLRTHERNVHGIDKRSTCADCNITLKNATGLRQHYLQKHKHELNYVCTFEDCGRRFKTNELLESHVEKMHKRNIQLFKCPTCQKSLFGKVALNRHLRSHSSIRKAPRKYICEHCGKSLENKSRLEIHYLSHSGSASWKFECSICSKKCLTQQKLDEHMRTHTKEKPFVCEICGEKYAHRHNLRNHVNSKHGKVAHDKPRKFNTANLTSRKGIKRKKVEEETLSESSCDSDSITSKR